MYVCKYTDAIVNIKVPHVSITTALWVLLSTVGRKMFDYTIRLISSSLYVLYPLLLLEDFKITCISTMNEGNNKVKKYYFLFNKKHLKDKT